MSSWFDRYKPSTPAPVHEFSAVPLYQDRNVSVGSDEPKIHLLKIETVLRVYPLFDCKRATLHQRTFVIVVGRTGTPFNSRPTDRQEYLDFNTDVKAAMAEGERKSIDRLRYCPFISSANRFSVSVPQ
jgi:hypothetical protein